MNIGWDKVVSGPSERQLKLLQRLQIDTNSISSFNEAQIALQTKLNSNKIRKPVMLKVIPIVLSGADDASLHIDEVGDIKIVVRNFVKTKSGKIKQIFTTEIDYANIKMVIKANK